MSDSSLPPLPDGYAFASALIKAREGRGYTQKQLSEACGVSLSAIKAYESGRNLPGSRELREICQSVQVSPNMLLFGVEAPFGSRSTIELLLGASDLPANGYGLASRLGLLASLLAPEERDALLTLATSLAVARHGDEVVRNNIRAHDGLLAASAAMMQGTATSLQGGKPLDANAIAAKFEQVIQDSTSEQKKTPKK